MDVVERLSLEAANTNTLLACEHIHRYEVAAIFCEGRRVIDVGCGVGYGPRRLADVAEWVTGIDNDAATIDMAEATFGETGKLRFETADAVSYLRRLDAHNFDVLVCFEALEHFADLDSVVAELHRLAAAGMQMVFSVPNSKTFAERNEHHVTDFGPEQLRELAAGFDDAVVLHQFLAEGSLVAEGGATIPESGHTRWFADEDRADPDYANHFLVFVNLPDAAARVADARMQQAVSPHYNRWMLQLETANRKLWSTNARIARDSWGHFDAAAASMIDKAERTARDIEIALKDAREARAENAAHVDTIRLLTEQRDEAFQRAQEAEWRFASLRQRKVVRAALAVARMRPGARR